MNKNEYITKYADHIDDASLSAIQQIPASAWDAVIEAMEAMDLSDPGIDCAVAVTHETLDDFDDARALRWSERGKCRRHVLIGFAASIYSGIQITKGQRRQSLAVVDCGKLRVCLTA